MKRRTLRGPTARLEGRGIHSGEPSALRVVPAPAGAGLTFRRTDLPGAPVLGIGDLQKSNEGGRTTLRRGDALVQTVEHVAAALWGSGLDDAEVEIEGVEPPAADGSALPFVEALEAAGIVEDSAERPVFRVASPLVAGAGNCTVVALPADGPRLLLRYRLDYPGEPLAQGERGFELTPEAFKREIAPARTFCPAAMAEKLRALGWGKGATAQNTLVLEGNRARDTELRFPDEPVRHKLLDMVGDLAFLGGALAAELRGTRSGHNLNRAILAAIRELCAVRNGGKTVYDVNQIRKFLPHRYPFLLVDRIVECEPGVRAVGLKNLTANEHFFQGHFPDVPVMPGVLQIEAMAQVGGILLSSLSGADMKDKVAVLASIDKVKLRRAVVPGDQLVMETRLVRMRGTSFGEVEATATVDGKLAAEAQIRFAIVPRSSLMAPAGGA
ncbi:MAG TPA: 3-hydroxyacyl-ACP dehydratase FabZ [Planctomycetota bacterium]|nr:3-hydroxyacyl-ACP dehydratase FabZ [Planctomycetota bacterium]